MQRFTGSVEALCEVYHQTMAAWAAAIPLSSWPLNWPPGATEWPDGQLKPSMVYDPAWHGFGDQAKAMTAQFSTLFPPGCIFYNPLLSVVMPGHTIAPHRDQQDSDRWLCRVHVPLATNPESKFIVDGAVRPMPLGFAYRVNTLAIHAVENDGATPRIHFFTDVWSAA